MQTALKITEDELAQELVKRGFLTTDTLVGLEQAQVNVFQQRQQQLRGIVYQFGLAPGILSVQDYLIERRLYDIALNTQYPPDNRSGDAVLAGAWDTQEWQYVALTPVDTCGLLVTDSWSGYFGTELLKQPYLLGTSHYLQPFAVAGMSTCLCDLALSPEREKLFVTDRWAGTLSIFATQSGEALAQLSIRQPGSLKALPLVFSTQQHMVYLTDQQSATLYTLSLDHLQLQKQRTNWGILGNVALAPNGSQAAVLVIKPYPALKLVDLPTQEVLTEIKLDHHLYSHDTDAPVDAMFWAPQENQFWLQMYSNHPAPFTAILQCFSGRNLKPLQALYPPEPLGCLALASPNSLADCHKPLSRLVVDSGLLNQSQVLQIKRDMLAERLEQMTGSQPPESTQTEWKPLDIQASTAHQSHQVYLRNAQNGPPIPLSPAATQEILDILQGALYQQHQLEVLDADELTALRQDADLVRQHLENNAMVEIQITPIMQHYTLQTMILRDAILEMTELRQNLSQRDIATAPSHCPVCHQPLLGSWDCNACGRELESPERMAKREVASVQAGAYLPDEILAIPDPLGHRLLQLNKDHDIIWDMDMSLLSCYRPWDVLWLPNQGLLVVDNELNQVVEYDGSGNRIWSMDTQQSPGHSLNQPVKVTCYTTAQGQRRYLIVDQGNQRVVEVDSQQHIHWQYGQLGDSSVLHTPSDVQYTHQQTYLIADTGHHRVLEIEHQTIKQIWDESHGLSQPIFAQRLLNGHTLMVSAGNFQVVEFDHHNQEVLRFTYDQPGKSSRFRMSKPIRVIRRSNRNLVLMDEYRIMELMPQTKKVVWFSLLQQLRPKANHQNPAPLMFNREASRQWYGSAPQQRFSLQGLLKKVPWFKGSEEAVFQELARRLKSVIFQKGDMIIRKGEVGTAMYFLNRGQVGVLAEDQKTVVVRMSEGDLFGEMALLLDMPRSASIRAEDYCELYRLQRSDLEEIMQRFPLFATKMERIANERRVLFELRVAEQQERLSARRTGSALAGRSLTTTAQVTCASDVVLDPPEIVLLDRQKNLLMQINRQGQEVWATKENSYTQPKHIQVTDALVWIADTGNARILGLSQDERQIAYELGPATGLDISQPQSVVCLPSGNLLIADPGYPCLIETTLQSTMVWDFTHPQRVVQPSYAEGLANGNILYADTRLHQVQEINRQGEVVWCYGTARKFGKQLNQLFAPEFATRLDDGTTLIADTGNNRIVSIERDGSMAWEFSTQGTCRLMRPSRLQVLPNGHILVFYNNEKQIAEITYRGQVLWTWRAPIQVSLATLKE